MADQYWRTPKKVDRSGSHLPRGYWYASPRGAIEIYTPSGVPIGKIKAADLRNFLNMLDNHNPRKRRG